MLDLPALPLDADAAVAYLRNHHQVLAAVGDLTGLPLPAHGGRQRHLEAALVGAATVIDQLPAHARTHDQQQLSTHAARHAHANALATVVYETHRLLNPAAGLPEDPHCCHEVQPDGTLRFHVIHTGHDVDLEIDIDLTWTQAILATTAALG